MRWSVWWAPQFTEWTCFWKVIGRATAYKRLLMAIKAEYDNTVRELKRREDEVRASRRTAAASVSLKESLMTCQKRANQLRDRCVFPSLKPGPGEKCPVNCFLCLRPEPPSFKQKQQESRSRSGDRSLPQSRAAGSQVQEALFTPRETAGDASDCCSLSLYTIFLLSDVQKLAPVLLNAVHRD